MSTADTGQAAVSEFIKRWESSGSAERANFHSFAKELCDVLGVPQPDPPSGGTRQWDLAMLRARGHAECYVHTFRGCSLPSPSRSPQT